MVSANVETNKLFAEQTTKAVQTKKGPLCNFDRTSTSKDVNHIRCKSSSKIKNYYLQTTCTSLYGSISIEIYGTHKQLLPSPSVVGAAGGRIPSLLGQRKPGPPAHLDGTSHRRWPNLGFVW
jgi:hypothetical protein